MPPRIRFNFRVFPHLMHEAYKLARPLLYGRPSITLGYLAGDDHTELILAVAACQSFALGVKRGCAGVPPANGGQNTGRNWTLRVNSSTMSSVYADRCRHFAG